MKVGIMANITKKRGEADSSFTTLCRDAGDIRLKNDRNVVGKRAVASLQGTGVNRAI